MGVDISAYRARIGCYYSKALAAQRKLSFIDQTLIIPLVCLLSHSVTNSNRLTLAVFIYFSLSTSQHNFIPYSKKSNTTIPSNRNIQFNARKDVTYPECHEKQLKTLQTLQIAYFFIFLLLILIAGDIHPNPGPSNINSKNISIVHINARSISKHKLELECEIGKYDIVTMSETWMSDSTPHSVYTFDGFQQPVRRDRPNDPHGGVAIYVKDNLICKPRPDLSVPNLEAVWIETKLGQETLLVGSMYRPPDSLAAYWGLIDLSIKNASHTPHKYVVLGDLNTDFLNNPSNHLLNIISMYNLQQLVKEPTRLTQNSATCIDLILTPSHDIVNAVEVLPPICSDHSVPWMCITNHTPNTFSYKRTIYDYKKLNSNKLSQELSSVDWLNLVSTTSIEEAAEMFSHVLFEKAKLCMPSKIVTVRQRDQPWITETIKQQIETKNKIHKTAKHLNTDQAWADFRKTRNELTDTIRRRKIEYDKDLDKRASSNDTFGTRDWWKLVKSFQAKKGSSTDTIPPIEKDGVVYYSNKEKADTFNDFVVKTSTVE